MMTWGWRVFRVWMVFWSMPIRGGSRMIYNGVGKVRRERCLASKT